MTQTVVLLTSQVFWLSIGIFTSIVTGFGQSQRAIDKKLPNIVFVLADDLGHSDVNCFNGLGSADYYETPNIDLLAKQGMIFSSAYTNGPNCAPTRAALMSGQYYPRQPVYTVSTGARGEERDRKLVALPNGNGLESEVYTMAEALRDAGYVTGHFGKWHLGKAGPADQGFSDESIVEVEAAGVTLGQNKKLSPSGSYIAEELNQKAVQFIVDHKESPFFLYLAHYVVHSPFQAPDSLVKKYLSKRPVMGHYHATYAAMVESLDLSVGRIMQKLDSLGLTENTCFIFYSDNGGLGGYIDQGMEGLPKLDPLDDGFGGTVEITHNAPLRGGKGQLYEGGVRVPLIIRWPSKIAPGRKSDEPVISIDFYPTLLELAQKNLPADLILDGVSIVPLFNDPEIKLERESLFWHFPGYLQSRKEGSWRTTPVGSIRSGDWKLLQFFEDNRLELYNLKEDIGEQNDLSKTHVAQRIDLLEKLESWRVAINAEIPHTK